MTAESSNSSSHLTREELQSAGFGSLGTDVEISRRASLYSPSGIFLGDRVRIDDFAVISASHGAVRLSGRNHVAAGAQIYGPVTLGLWSTVSGRSALYGISDDFSRLEHTYPQYPHELRVAQVVLGQDVVVGTGSTVLPGVEIADGVAIGAMSLVTSNLGKPGVYAGIPVRRVSDRVAR